MADRQRVRPAGLAHDAAAVENTALLHGDGVQLMPAVPGLVWGDGHLQQWRQSLRTYEQERGLPG